MVQKGRTNGCVTPASPKSDRLNMVLNFESHFEVAGVASVNVEGEPTIDLIGPATFIADATVGHHIDFEPERWRGNSDLDAYSGYRTICRDLVLETDIGTLTSRGTFSISRTHGNSMHFKPTLCVWEPNDARHPVAMRVPLLNLVAPFGGAHNTTSVYVPDFDGGRIDLVLLNKPAYMVAHSDYGECYGKLEDSESDCEVTSSLIMETIDKYDDFETLRHHFLWGFFPLLNLASGIEVGCPWIDQVDTLGNMVSRSFVSWQPHPYRPGHAVIGDASTTAWSQLVAAGTNSEHFGQLYYRAATIRSVRSGQSGQVIEDRLAHAVRAFDNLGSVKGTSTVNVKLILAEEYKELLALVDGMKEQVRLLQARASATDVADKVEVLESLVRKAPSLLSVNKKTGRAVSDLARSLGLPDADIMETFFRSICPQAEYPWSRQIDSLRNQALHQGYFDQDSSDPLYRYIGRTIQHLRDILQRVLLKLIGYDGFYRSLVAQTTWSSVDWVQATTRASELGYREGIQIDVDKVKALPTL